jgi:hypothetical protein
MARALKLVTLIGTVMFVLGILFRSSETWKLALLVLLFAWLISGLRDVFSWLMRKKQGIPIALKTQLPFLILLVCLAVLAIVKAQPINKDLTIIGKSLVTAQAKLRGFLNSNR